MRRKKLPGICACSLGAAAPGGATLSALEALKRCDRIFVERPSPAAEWALSIVGRKVERATVRTIYREARRGRRVGIVIETRSPALTALRRRCLAEGLPFESVPSSSSIDRLLVETGWVFGHDIVGFRLRDSGADVVRSDGRVETLRRPPRSRRSSG